MTVDRPDSASGMAAALEGGRRARGLDRRVPAGATLVSVVIGVRNGAETIRDAIESVLGQSYPHVELIVIDGASTDGTLEILRGYGDQIDLWKSESDRGIYDAWNKALAVTRGQWIGFLGADDAYKPAAIAHYLRVLSLSENSGVDFISSRVELVDVRGRTLRVIGKPWHWRGFRKFMTVAHVGALHHRRLFDMHGKFDVRYRIAGDYEFLLRAGPSLCAAFLDETTARMRAGGLSSRDLSVFAETLDAKARSGRRSRVASQLEMYAAVAKYLVRSAIDRMRTGS